MITYSKPENINLANLLQFKSLAENIDMNDLPEIPGIETFPLFTPDEHYKFLHEAAVIAFHGEIFCSWYNCPITELLDYTPIRGCRSKDGGKTWSKVELIAHDPEKKLLYCPPVYGICDDTLYLMINSMVSADFMHSMEFYRYDEKTEKFCFLRSEPLPFKLNTNVYQLNNGKLLLPGRIAEMDSFPTVPAVLISDSGKIDAPWRLVKVQEDNRLPDGTEFEHPEQSAVIQPDCITLFCRNDNRNLPIIYQSSDNGETWSDPIHHDIPFTNSKIYSGTLSDGRHYVIGNISTEELPPYADGTRDKLAIFVTSDSSLKFTAGYLIRNGYDAKYDLHPQWSYPCAFENDGKLFIIYSAVAEPGKLEQRAAMMSIVDIRNI